MMTDLNPATETKRANKKNRLLGIGILLLMLLGCRPCLSKPQLCARAAGGANNLNGRRQQIDCPDA
ncbi:MAG: hypothetical protein WA125_05485 [Desulfosporosinus sp.]